MTNTTQAAGLTDEQIVRQSVDAMPHTNPGVAQDLLDGFTTPMECNDVIAVFNAGYRAALAAQAVPAGWIFKRNVDGSIGIFGPLPKPGESQRTSDCVPASNHDLHELLGRLADHQATTAEAQAAQAAPAEAKEEVDRWSDEAVVREQATAWFHVADTLTEVAQWWRDLDGTGMEKAAKAIRQLATLQPQVAQPVGDPDVADIIAGALQTSRAHALELIRDAASAGALTQAAGLTEDERMEADAVYTLTSEGWCWDGDQWQRPQPQAAQPAAVIAARLTAMASYYTRGHSWDHLDAETCTQAAALLRTAAPALTEEQERIVDHTVTYLRDCVNSPDTAEMLQRALRSTQGGE